VNQHGQLRASTIWSFVLLLLLLLLLLLWQMQDVWDVNTPEPAWGWLPLVLTSTIGYYLLAWLWRKVFPPTAPATTVAVTGSEPSLPPGADPSLDNAWSGQPANVNATAVPMGPVAPYGGMGMGAPGMYGAGYGSPSPYGSSYGSMYSPYGASSYGSGMGYSGYSGYSGGVGGYGGGYGGMPYGRNY
jgi:hypothetical protein